MNFKNFNLKTKLFGTISVTIAFVISISILLIMLKINEMAKNDSSEIIQEISEKWALDAKLYLETPYQEAESFIKLLEGELTSGNKRLTRDQLDAMMKNHILKSTEYLGIWVCFEPNAFDGLDSTYRNSPSSDKTGRYIPYWTKGNGQGQLDPLVNYEVPGEGDYYLLARNSGKETFLEPYKYKIGEDSIYMTSICIPIKVNGKVVGVGGIDIQIDNIVKKFNTISFFENGFVTLFAESGTVIASKRTDILNKKIADITDNERYIDGLLNRQKGLVEFKSKIDNEDYLVASNPVKIGNTESIWYISAYIPKAEIFAPLKSITYLIIIIGIFAIFLITGVIWKVANSITIPIFEGVNFAQKVAQGDLTAIIEIEQKDEIGQLAQALKEMIHRLKNIVSNIRAGADILAAASLQISSSTQSLSQGSTEQASSVEEVSATMEEMASNIAQNTNNAQEAEKISIQAQKGIIEVSNISMKSVEASKIIAGKIQIINEIAFQTNILALNAAVEAARAGEHGKGFAVVASEVRKLAERSKIAADEIVILAANSVQYAQGAGDLLKKTLPEIEKSTKLVQEIANASLEQNNGATQVNNAVQQLNEVTQSNASTAEEIASSTEELNSQAESLKDLVAYFKILEEEQFYKNVKTVKPLFKEKVNYKSTAFSEKEKVKSFKLNMSSDNEMPDDFEKY